MKHEKTLKLLREEIFQKKRHQVDDRTGGKLKFVAATSFQIPIGRITTFRFLSYWAGVTHQDPPFNLWTNWVVGFHVASHDVSVQLSNLIVLPGRIIHTYCYKKRKKNSLVLGQSCVPIASIGDVHGDDHRVASLVVQICPCSILTRLYAAHSRIWGSLYVVHNLDS